MNMTTSLAEAMRGGWGSKRGRERDDLERGDQKKTKERTLRRKKKEREQRKHEQVAKLARL